MSRPLLLILGAFFLAACGSDSDDAKSQRGERMVIRTKMIIAALDGSEPIATGKVLKESTLGSSSFCAGGTILDSHADNDPAMKPTDLIARTITCPDGRVKIGMTPEVGPQGPSGKGTWRIVSGTGAFKGLRGRGRSNVVMDPDDESIGRETLTAIVTR